MLTLNNELEITQTKEKKKRVPHYLERNTDAESSFCIGKGRETPIKRLEDAIHSLDWASGEIQQLDRGKKKKSTQKTRIK